MEHKLHLYTGDGKGKTTAAMGLALRGLGHGQRVLVAQFVKDGQSGELNALRTFGNAYVFDGAKLEGFTWQLSPEELEAAKAAHRRSAGELLDRLNAEKPQLMIFDELAMAVQLGLVEEETMWQLIRTGLSLGEVVVTGYSAPQSLREQADYLSEIRKLRHPYDQGLEARPGVEW
ncbi:MAG: cob(I)yrinic acid a,c-diamide adenosyltransferase [Clostridiales bacterium]|nr:cob(I)yrinic acid a,c-diamide adenosyltransferase [Clostridiales bacterium]